MSRDGAQMHPPLIIGGLDEHGPDAFYSVVKFVLAVLDDVVKMSAQFAHDPLAVECGLAITFVVEVHLLLSVWPLWKTQREEGIRTMRQHYGVTLFAPQIALVVVSGFGHPDLVPEGWPLLPVCPLHPGLTHSAPQLQKGME